MSSYTLTDPCTGITVVDTDVNAARSKLTRAINQFFDTAAHEETSTNNATQQGFIGPPNVCAPNHCAGILGTLSDETFRAEFERRFPFVDLNYIQTMNEVGVLGDIKHGDNCIERRVQRGDYSRYGERVYRSGFRKHSDEHWREYIEGIKHDAFNTARHQVGAVGYNGMLEFKLSRLAGEGADTVQESLDKYRKDGERA